MEGSSLSNKRHKTCTPSAIKIDSYESLNEIYKYKTIDVNKIEVDESFYEEFKREYFMKSGPLTDLSKSEKKFKVIKIVPTTERRVAE